MMSAHDWHGLRRAARRRERRRIRALRGSKSTNHLVPILLRLADEIRGVVDRQSTSGICPGRIRVQGKQRTVSRAMMMATARRRDW